MKDWDARVASGDKPRYVAIADALSADIADGRLAAGQQLPTHRDLAETLGVTVGTVSRAYREAEHRGLVVGEVGRGTFVRRPSSGADPGSDARGGLIDLGVNSMRIPDGSMLVPQALTELARDPAVVRLLEDYQPQAGLPEHREAGSSLIAEAGWKVHPDRVLVCAGAQHATTVALMGLCQPGDTLLTGALTHPTLMALARTLRLNLVGVALDEQGIEPSAFEDACIDHRPQALYCMPTLHNPTTRTMSAERRATIAQIALRYDVAVLESDVHGFMAEDSPPPLSSWMDAEYGYYLTSCSKRIAPGLRVGYLVVPRGEQGRFLDALWSTTGMAPPLMAEIASRWIRDGTAASLAEARRAESATRQGIARAVLHDHPFECQSTAGHAWLPLPPAWRDTASFVGRAMAAGVAVTPRDAFAATKGGAPAVRLSLGAPPSREIVRRGLEIVAELLHGVHPLRVV
ncbi:MAG: PLP-dependent aminotransferase family protein [Myxococcota bacterium]